MLRAKKGTQVEVTRGGKEGLTGTVVGKGWVSGSRKVKLDDGATMKGDSVIRVSKKKLKKMK